MGMLLILVSLTGLIGVYEHYETRQQNRLEAQSLTVSQDAQQAAPVGDEDNPQGTAQRPDAALAASQPPPLAPLSLSGLSIVAAVAVLGASRKEDMRLEPAPSPA